ncbi:MAG: hypothetical protein IPL57_12660 [Rubrivivax sp.]|nr:hypothetical protein [Rubrivivax sp.]
MTTEEAVALRKALERDLLVLLQKYRDATGLTPLSVDVQTADITTCGSDRSIALTGVRVTVEV